MIGGRLSVIFSSKQCEGLVDVLWQLLPTQLCVMHGGMGIEWRWLYEKPIEITAYNVVASHTIASIWAEY